MKRQNKRIQAGPDRLDPIRIRERRDALGIKSDAELAELADISRSTLAEYIATGTGSEKTTAALMLALEAEEGLLKRSLPQSEIAESAHRLVAPRDWKIVSVESQCLIAANGVSYQVAKLESDLIAGRFMRGKFYDLLHVPPAKLPELVERLTRHAKVCHQLRGEPTVCQHVDIRRLDENTAWWVLDEWIESTPLSTLLDAGVAFPLDTIKSIGTDLLTGLAKLHEHKIVMRELAPERILMVNSTSNCVLTDFELAKLLVGDISVSGKWKCITPYRAPEVGENEPKVQSDLFSWAVVMTEVITGDFVLDVEKLKKITGDEKITRLIKKCRDIRYHHREPNANLVLKQWERWKPESI